MNKQEAKMGGSGRCNIEYQNTPAKLRLAETDKEIAKRLWAEWRKYIGSLTYGVDNSEDWLSFPHWLEEQE